MATPAWIKHFDDNRLKNDSYDETWSTTMLSDFTESTVSILLKRKHQRKFTLHEVQKQL